MKKTLQRSLFWAVVVSESSHVFCCILPTVFSLLGLLTGLGIVVGMPGFLAYIHDAMHPYEIPLIVFSAVTLAAGWAITIYSEKIDCHDTGCVHGGCNPQKSNVRKVMIIATVLFSINLGIYLTVHRSHWFITAVGSQIVRAQDHDHAHEGHHDHQ